MGQGLDTGRRRGYRVCIIYTEPEFQRRNPHCPPEFSSLFELRHTQVGWTRVIKSVVVESLPGHA